MESLGRYICSFSDHLQIEPKSGVGRSALSRVLGTQQMGVSVVMLPPGTRSCLPHAESGEEEFAYVLSGQPSIWINGETYQLRAGHAVGFASGMGVCHTIINDGPEPAYLVNIGERTKTDNLCAFPLNPEQAATSDMAWKNWPAQKFGAHPGTPGSGIAPRDPEGVPEILFAPSLEGRGTFSYRGDTETFAAGVRLNKKLNLKMIGIHHEIMSPGKRSSWPHAESLEEEFCFVLRGNPTIWINGYLFAAKPGDLVFFEPRTNLAHTVLNETSEDVEYLGFGLTAEALPGGKIYYPYHPARNEECRAKGHLWEDRPHPVLGPDEGRPRGR